MFENSGNAIDKAERVESFRDMVASLESHKEGIADRISTHNLTIRHFIYKAILAGEIVDLFKKHIFYNKPLDSNEIIRLDQIICGMDDWSETIKEFPAASGFKERIETYYRDLHAAMGRITEGTENLQSISKTIFCGNEYDRTNKIEEMGDELFYIQIDCNILGIDIYEVMRVNQAKLTKRYGEKLKFTSEAAINRDHDKERQVMESELGNT